MKQFCNTCNRLFRNRQRRIECPSCEITRYNKGLKTKRNKNMFKNQENTPEGTPENTPENTPEEEKKEEGVDTETKEE